MDYFKGITFLGFGDNKSSHLIHHRQFDGFYGIQYNHHGTFNFAKGNDSLINVTGAYAFISHPNQTFYYGPPERTNRHHCYICFKGPRVQQYIQHGLISTNSKQPLIKVIHSERFYSILLQIMKILSTPGSRQYNRAVLLLEDALLQLYEQPIEKAKINSYLQSEIESLEETIRKNSELDWEFHKEAKLLGISYSHFLRIFKQIIGISPRCFVNECRLFKATEMLTGTDEQIHEIAGLCGFNDKFYFSRLFKKHYHLSPFHYRKEFK